MRVWLVTVGEPLPTDGLNDRLHRAGMLAGMLSTQGHDVVWWTSTFDHARKRQRFIRDTAIDVNDHLRIELLHSVGYKKNVSLSRIINHYSIARKFSKLAESRLPPDIILCSIPTLELGLAATKYGRKKGVPVVLDVRDLWPDIFLDLMPQWGRWLARRMLTPMYRITRSACAGATAITGVTQAYVKWGVSCASRPQTNLDRDFPFSYSEKIPSHNAIMASEEFWKKYGIVKGEKEFIVCFFGTLGRQFDLEIVIAAARKLRSQCRPFRFVLCGTGDNIDLYRDMARDCENVLFPGWIGTAEIWTLMRMSSVGLAPYRSSQNFVGHIPNKPIEYLSAGLPIVSALDGILEELLLKYDCGVSYANSDADGLAEVLNDLYDHPERLETMSKNAYALYRERFVAEKVYAEMIDYLQEVADSYKNNDHSFTRCHRS